MNDTKYPKGTIATFNPKYGECKRSGEEVVVTGHGDGNDGSGFAHSIKFTKDNEEFGGAVYPQELTDIKLGTEGSAN